MWSMWSAARLTSAQSSVGSTDGLALLLQVVAIGETLAGRHLSEASTSSILAWEEVSTGGGEASDLWGRSVTASTITTFPVGECSDLWLDLPAIAWVSRLSTSVAMLIHGFVGVLGELVAVIVFTSSTGEVGHPSSSSGGGGMLILM